MSTHLDALERVITDVVAPAATTEGMLDFIGRAISGLPLLGPVP